MKRIIEYITFTIISGYWNNCYSQVGINTETPQATLDVKSSASDLTKTDGIIIPSLTGEELKMKDDLYTALQNGTIIYITEPLVRANVSSKTENVLDVGFYGFDANIGQMGKWIPLFNGNTKSIEGGNIESTPIITPITIQARSSNTQTANLYTRTFTLDRKSTVNLSFSIPVRSILDYNGNILTDGANKAYGILVYLSKLSGDGNLYNQRLIFRDSHNFSNSGNNYASGNFYLGNSRQIILEQGNYEIIFQAYVFAVDNIGIRASFGESSLSTIIDIIAEPLLYY